MLGSVPLCELRQPLGGENDRAGDVRARHAGTGTEGVAVTGAGDRRRARAAGVVARRGDGGARGGDRRQRPAVDRRSAAAARGERGDVAGAGVQAVRHTEDVLGLFRLGDGRRARAGVAGREDLQERLGESRRVEIAIAHEDVFETGVGGIAHAGEAGRAPGVVGTDGAAEDGDLGRVRERDVGEDVEREEARLRRHAEPVEEAAAVGEAGGGVTGDDAGDMGAVPAARAVAARAGRGSYSWRRSPA